VKVEFRNSKVERSFQFRFSTCLWHWIKPASTPRVAFGHAADGQPQAFDQSMLAQRFHTVLGTGGRETAFGAEPGRDNQLVEPDRHEEWKDEYIPEQARNVLRPIPGLPTPVMYFMMPVHAFR
jgi:hypothetical protein